MRHFVKVMHEICEIGKGNNKETVVKVYPDYLASGKDIMKKGGKFYAFLNLATSMWCTDESKVVEYIDNELYSFVNENYLKDGFGVYRDSHGHRVIVSSLDNSSTGRLKEFNVWMFNLPSNHNYIQLDTSITFKDDKVTPEMYRSKRLNYNVKDESIDSYLKIMTTLYSAEDIEKIEWIIGSIFTGDSKKIEKMLVFYGDPGTGKSTILDLIKDLFDGYWVRFVASELVSGTNQFGTAAFKDNPLLAIQDDGKMTKIESPMINEFVSHKDVTINEKGKQQYVIHSNAMLILASNDAVDMHDIKHGITRRLLDVYPTGKRIPVEEYDELVEKLKFEKGGIAHHCIEVYKSRGKRYYEGYVPDTMIRKTNYIQNWLFDNLDRYSLKESFLRDDLYEDFKRYCEDSGLGYPPKRIDFTDQIKPWFETYNMYGWIDGKSKRHVYSGLKIKKISGINDLQEISKEKECWIVFKEQESAFDKLYFDLPAQYDEDGRPEHKWSNAETKLSEIDTRKVHWVKVPIILICIDFDLVNEEGKKDLKLNLKAASKFPKTYAELSKSGEGIHLYYIWDGGDPEELSRVYDDHIEVKVFSGNSALRRMLTKCNDLPIAHLSSGLPIKGGKKVIDENIIINEKALRTTISRCLAKEIHGDTRSNIDWIYKILEDAYKSGTVYDVSDMRQDILIFAANSTNQSDYCIKKVGEMKFMSEERAAAIDSGYRKDDPIIFFDFEVKPNMNLLCWKFEGDDQKVNKIFNPSPEYMADFLGLNSKTKKKIVGYNNKNYDNVIAYMIYLGKSPYEVYLASQAIINKEYGAVPKDAKNLSYSDVLDFLPTKQSLKKWEIQLKIPHKEFELPWDEPIPEELWPQLAEYCANDVIATEAVFKANQAAWKGRQILCDLANIIMGPGSTVNDSTNDLTTKLIVGDERNPQKYFVYPDLSKEFPGYEFDPNGIDPDRYISKDVIISGKSIYRGYDPGEGGFVYAKRGMYTFSKCYDSASHHPSSLIAENGFGPFTKNFKLLLDLRLHIKHKEYDVVRKMFNGALAKYLETDEDAEALSYALKIAINSVYGLTSAKFPNRLRDIRNKDNWVAKRGALFMIDLMLNVREMGYTVIHCKTDSIKIVDPDEKVQNYICEYGKKFGYTFEVEHVFDRICLVNDAVYICKYTDDPENGKKKGKWDATGKQFQVPYVFKSLFSGEQIGFEDMCETKSSSTALYLDMNEGLPEGDHNYQFIGKTGLFCPIKEGCGGGKIVRDAGNGKYAFAEGTKDFKWLESEVVKNLHKEEDIDKDYYRILVDKAVEAINKYGDFDWFVSDGPTLLNQTADDYELPFN